MFELVTASKNAPKEAAMINDQNEYNFFQAIARINDSKGKLTHKEIDAIVAHLKNADAENTHIQRAETLGFEDEIPVMNAKLRQA